MNRVKRTNSDRATIATQAEQQLGQAGVMGDNLLGKLAKFPVEDFTDFRIGSISAFRGLSGVGQDIEVLLVSLILRVMVVHVLWVQGSG